MPKAPPTSSVRTCSSSGLTFITPATAHAHAGDALRAGSAGEALARRVVACGRGARLERGDDQPLVDQLDLHHMRGFGEGACRARPASCRRDRPARSSRSRHCPALPAKAAARRARSPSRTSVTGVERLVVDRDLLGGVLRGAAAGRHDHRDRLADMHHARRRRAPGDAARTAACHRGRELDARARREW